MFCMRGRIFTLPCVHIYDGCPGANFSPQPFEHGLAKMRAIADERCPDWKEFFSDAQLERLALHSGGDLCDYFRLLQFAALGVLRTSELPVSDLLIIEAEHKLINDMGPIPHDHRAWLAKIMESHEPELADLDALPDFARFLSGKRVLQYRNGKDWYDVHPLLRDVINGT